jgi:hypothetical protein
MRIKYPRTFHFPWSMGASDDDKILNQSLIDSSFSGNEIVVTEKLDGENTTIYSDGYVHARSLDSSHHPSRSWVKNFARNWAHELPDGWRVCGENLFAKHSIKYTDLPSYFFVFAIYDEHNVCLSWDETSEWAKMLNLEIVPVLYRGPWVQGRVMNCYDGKSKFGIDVQSEGYVVRTAGSFKYDNFANSVAKFVRANHVLNDTRHWAHSEIIPNELIKNV